MRQDTGTQSLGDDFHRGGKDSIVCRIVGHSRSSKLAFTDGDGIWKSRWKRCGRVMVRIKYEQWVV